MVPFFGLFQLLQVLGQLFGSQESRAVNPLQLLAMLVPSPVGTGDAEDMKAVGIDLARRAEMRARGRNRQDRPAGSRKAFRRPSPGSTPLSGAPPAG